MTISEPLIQSKRLIKKQVAFILEHDLLLLLAVKIEKRGDRRDIEDFASSVELAAV